MIKESSSDRLLKAIIYIVLSILAIYCVDSVRDRDQQLSVNRVVDP